MPKLMKNLGTLAFVVGVLGALLIGLLAGLKLFTAGTTLITVLVVAGILIGLLNITGKEAVPIMIAAGVIGISSGVLAGVPVIGTVLTSMFKMLAVVAAPTAIVVAIGTFVKKAM